MCSRTTSMRIFLASSVILALTGAAIEQTGTPPKFEVSFVKRAATDEFGSEISTAPSGRVTIANLPLKAMIVYAWGVKPFQISGAKGWIESQRYDVVAKPENKPKE